jgi:hypothetical protein
LVNWSYSISGVGTQENSFPRKQEERKVIDRGKIIYDHAERKPLATMMDVWVCAITIKLITDITSSLFWIHHKHWWLETQ